MSVVRVSYFEIYNYEIRDLLSKDPTTQLKVEEHPDFGTYLKDVTTFIVNNTDDMDRVMTFGNKNRLVKTASTDTGCPRSHAIFSITVESRQAEENGEEHLTIGRLHLVDLFQIGSGNRNDYEIQCPVKDHDDDNNEISNSYNYIKRKLNFERSSEIGPSRLHEGTKINLPLTTLENVISALLNRKCIQIPYCNSRFKHLLQNSLAENSKTITSAIIDTDGSNNNIDESEVAHTSRAKYISNETKTNENTNDALLRQFEQEIKILKHQLDDGNAEFTISDNEVEVEISTREDKIDSKHYKMHKRKSMNINQLADRNCDLNRNSEEVNNNLKQFTNNEAHDEQIAATTRKPKHKLLQDKLNRLEMKIFFSEENLVEKAKQQERLLEIFTKKFKKIQSEEQLLEKKLKEKEAERGDMEAKHSILKKEAVASSKNLTKLQDLLQLAQEEQKEVIKDNQYEMERRLDVLKQLTKEIGLQKALIKNYIPNKFKELIVQHLHWNKDIGEWQLQHIATGKKTAKSLEQKMDAEVSLNAWKEYIKTLYKLKKSSDSSDVWFSIFPENHQERLYSFI